MRSPQNAVTDVMDELGMNQTVRETVEQDPESIGRWLITFESVPGSLIHSRLHIEVMEGDPHPFACVLERQNVGYRPMSRIMDKLMRRLERPRSSRPLEQSPPAGEPRTPSPRRDRRDPPEDDMTRRRSSHMRM